jgi:hypothetical protein
MAIAKLTSVTLVTGSGSPATKLQASAHGPVKFDVLTFVGPNKVGGNLGYTGTVGNAGLAAGLGAIRKNTPTILDVRGVGIGSYTYSYDPDTDMLRIFTTGTTPAEVVDATDLSGVTFKVLVISI